MKALLRYSLLIALLAASAARSETCVSDTFERPLPDAVDIEVRHADVPSPRFPGIWQEGWIDGFFYRIWSNKEAVLQSNRKSPSWSISVLCNDDTAECQNIIEGAPSTAALETVGDLSGCLKNAAFSGQAQPVVETQSPVEPVAEVVTTTIDPAPQSPCGLATVPDGPSGLTLQRLLVEAGGDPGQLDGLVGPKTYNALIQILGPSAQSLDLDAAITAIDAYLCLENPGTN